MMKENYHNKSFEQVNVGLYSDGNLSLKVDVIQWPGKLSVISYRQDSVIYKFLQEGFHMMVLKWLLL